jgi:hypothetical protein
MAFGSTFVDVVVSDGCLSKQMSAAVKRGTDNDLKGYQFQFTF